MNNAGIRMEIAKKAPLYMYQEYLSARNNPYIVHYAGWEKPWDMPELDMAEYFWDYARRCPFYELLVLFMNRHKLNNSEEVINNYYDQAPKSCLGHLIRRFFQVWKQSGFKAAIRATKKRLSRKNR